MTDKNATDGAAAPQSSEPEAAKQPAGWIKPVIEFGSLIAFFVAFQMAGIYVATATFMVTHPLAMLAAKKWLGHIAKIQWFTLVIVVVMGGLTLYLQDETFVKMKLTVINGIFGAALIFGLLNKRLYLKTLFEMAFEIDDDGWRKFTINYVIFFLSMALINEAIWRTQSTDFWVNFKTFGYMGIHFLFIISQMPMLMKHMPHEE